MAAFMSERGSQSNEAPGIWQLISDCIHFFTLCVAVGGEMRLPFLVSCDSQIKHFFSFFSVKIVASVSILTHKKLFWLVVLCGLPKQENLAAGQRSPWSPSRGANNERLQNIEHYFSYLVTEKGFCIHKHKRLLQYNTPPLDGLEENLFTSSFGET